MTSKRLTIAGIQIYFSDDTGQALFDGRGKQRAAVEQELSEYRDFIDRWLEASEEPTPRRLSAEEKHLRAVLKGIAKAVKRHLPANSIEAVLRAASEIRAAEFPGATPEQVEAAIAEAISTL